MSTTSPTKAVGAIGKPTYASNKKTVTFVIHKFADLKDKKEGHYSSPIDCHGLQWKLCVFPFGKTELAKEEECISAYIHCNGSSKTRNVEAKCYFRVPGVCRTKFGTTYVFDHQGWGYDRLVERTKALENFDDHGALIIEIDLEVFKERKEQWHPPTLQNDLLRLYHEDKLVDVTFDLGSYVVRAHKLILAMRSPCLYDMAMGVEMTNGDNKGITKVELPDDVDADLFAIMIQFMYSDVLPEYFDLKVDGLTLLKMADRFGCSVLKIFLEAELVEADFVTQQNAADILLLADSHSCALLKETAMELIITNLSAITPTTGWKNLKQSADLLAEVFEYQATQQSAGINQDNNNDDNDNQDESVSGMRKRLSELGEDVDGTKETLAKRLKSNK